MTPQQKARGLLFFGTKIWTEDLCLLSSHLSHAPELILFCPLSFTFLSVDWISLVSIVWATGESGGGEQGEEMTQTVYAHVNKWIKNK
jgi:hypothetical protein